MKATKQGIELGRVRIARRGRGVLVSSDRCGKDVGKMPGAAGRIESAYVRALRGRRDSSSCTSTAHNNCDDIFSEDGDEIQDLNDPAPPAAESGRTRLFDLITFLVLGCV